MDQSFKVTGFLVLSTDELYAAVFAAVHCKAATRPSTTPSAGFPFPSASFSAAAFQAALHEAFEDQCNH